MEPVIAFNNMPDHGWYICMDPIQNKGNGDRYLHNDGIVRNGAHPIETGYYPTLGEAEDILRIHQNKE